MFLTFLNKGGLKYWGNQAFLMYIESKISKQNGTFLCNIYICI